jgi:fatty acid desaturase
MVLRASRASEPCTGVGFTHGTRSAENVARREGGTRRRFSDPTVRGGFVMLWAIFVILLAMWVLGMVTSFTMGGFIHILLILAIAAVLIRIIQGRRPVV